MKTVYAFRDNGVMSSVSRWKPRRVDCTAEADHSDAPGVEHVVKYVTSSASAACAISELICTRLMAVGGVRVLEARFVHVSEGFAKQCSDTIGLTIRPGLHYGTVLLTAVESGPPLRVEQLALPQQLVDIWAFDTLVCNIDRGNEGNILMMPTGAGFKFELIAADQSDCFCGAQSFQEGTWCNGFEKRQAAEFGSDKIWSPTIFSAGALVAVDSAIRKVRTALQAIESVLGTVPNEWWNTSTINPETVCQHLVERADRLNVLLGRDHWVDVARATEGGHVI